MVGKSSRVPEAVWIRAGGSDESRHTTLALGCRRRSFTVHADSARSGKRRRTDSRRGLQVAAIAFSVEPGDWPGPHCWSAGREALVIWNSPVSERSRATSRSFTFRFCEEHRKRSKASSGVISSRSIKIPFA